MRDGARCEALAEAIGVAAQCRGHVEIVHFKCAVIELGNDDSYWDCRYRTVEECVPHILAGNRDGCNVNPWPHP